MSAPSRPQTTRDRLHRAAIRVFARSGFHATKISDIVAEAAVTQPTFYIHFATKEAAYEALVEEFRAKLREATRQCLIFPDIAPETLHDHVRDSFVRFLTVMSEDPDLTEIGFYQPPNGRITKARMVEWSVHNMTHEQGAGILRPDIPVEYQARMVVGLLDQMGRLAPAEVETVADICARLFCSALVVRRSGFTEVSFSGASSGIM